MEPRGLTLPIPESRFGAENPDGEKSLELLRLAKAGDIAAFEELLRIHQRQVLMTALLMLGHRQDAEDAAQEVFFRLHKHLKRFDEAREFSPWLYRVTVNACRDLMRQRRKHSSLSVEAVTASTSGEPDFSEERKIVADGLLTLPEKERAAVILRDIEGLSTKEVARILGSSEATVRSQIFTARLKIKRFADRVLGRRHL